MRYRLCDTAQEISGISVELVIRAEPFADDVPYELALHAGGLQVARVERAAMTPAELFALGHALLDAAADGFGHFVPADEVFGLDLAHPACRWRWRGGVTVWVDSGRAAAINPPQRRGRAAGRRRSAPGDGGESITTTPRVPAMMPSRSAANHRQVCLREQQERGGSPPTPRPPRPVANAIGTACSQVAVDASQDRQNWPSRRTQTVRHRPLCDSTTNSSSSPRPPPRHLATAWIRGRQQPGGGQPGVAGLAAASSRRSAMISAPAVDRSVHATAAHQHAVAALTIIHGLLRDVSLDSSICVLIDKRSRPPDRRRW
jgi:hypothetical protein